MNAEEPIHLVGRANNMEFVKPTMHLRFNQKSGTLQQQWAGSLRGNFWADVPVVDVEEGETK